MDFDLKDALSKSMVGQKRTGRQKQFVFIQDEVVVKGPYKKDRLDNVFTRTEIFDQWQTPCVVKPLNYFTSKDGLFIRFPNIMKGYELESESHTESWSGIKYNILYNPPVIDMRQSLLKGFWLEDKIEDLLVGLCHCNILGVGDMNLRNILVDPLKKEYYIIDFDENLNQDREDEVFYFNKPPGKKLDWYAKVRPYYSKVADTISLLLKDELVIKHNLVSRVNRVIELLKKYSKETDKEIEKEKGKMVWKGLRGGYSKTFSGVDFDIAKSAVQKYIRRNKPFKAILAAVEMYRLGEIGGKAGVSNLYNRLAIIANEDIGPANLPLVLKVTEIVESKDRDIYRLAAMVQLLAVSSKTRIMSHAYYVYANPEGRKAAAKMGVELDTQFTESDKKYIIENTKMDIFLLSDPEELRPYILIFLKRLLEKDINAFSWLYFYLDSSKDKILEKRSKFIGKKYRGTTTKSTILLWRALAKVLPVSTHDILVKAYYNHTENRPFLQNAVMVALYRLPYKDLDIEYMVEKWKKEPLLNRILAGEFTLEIDDYVIDKHTRQGRALGKGTREFVREGAVVIPQDEKYYNKVLEEIYQSRT